MKVQVLFILCLLIFCEQAFGDSDCGQLENLIERSHQLEKSGNFSEAAKVNQAILNCQDPGNGTLEIEARLRLVKLMEFMGMMDSSFFQLQLIKPKLALVDDDMIQLKFQLAEAHYYLAQEDVETAGRLMEKALTQSEKLGDRKLEGDCYLELSRIEHYKYNFLKAIEFIEKADRIYSDILPKEDLAFSYTNKALGDNHFLLHRHEDALQHYLLAERIAKKNLPANHPFLLRVYNEAGATFLETGNPEMARVYLRRTANTFEQGVVNHSTADAFYYLGLISLEEENYSQAIRELKQSEINFERVYGYNSYWVSTTLVLIGDVYKQWAKYDSAIHYYHEALRSNNASEVPADLSYNPELNESFTPAYFIVALLEKAHSLKLDFEVNGNISSLKNSYDSYLHLMDVIDEYRKSFTEEEIQVEFGNDISEVYPEAIECAYLNFKLDNNESYVEAAFSIAEKSKSYVLLNSLQRADEIEEYGMIESIAKERKTKDRIEQVEARLAEAKIAKSEVAITILKDSLVDLRVEYNRQIQRIKDDHPEYYNTRFGNEFSTIGEIQTDFLEEGQVLISYKVGEDNSYLIWATPDRSGLMELDFTRNYLDSMVRKFRSVVLDGNRTDFPATSHQLYLDLLQPVSDLIDGKKLVIVPDQILNYLPFELLTSEKPEGDNPRNWPYIIKRNLVSYQFTATIGMENSERKHSDKTFQVLALAPEFNVSDSLLASLTIQDTIRSNILPLRGSLREVGSIQQFFQGSFETGETATEKVFKDRASSAQVIHLATHAILDDDNPIYSKIVFALDSTDEDGYLHAFELQKMDIQSELITLSACNTGFGQIKYGEGVMSLGRAFAYAGSPNIVMSLWPASDGSTALLMGYFYEYLHQGLPKDEALHMAKLRFIEEADSQATDPYYWGSFVFFGNPRPLISQPNRLTPLPYLILVLALAYLVYRVIRSRINSASDRL